MTDLRKAAEIASEALDTLLAENNVANREYAAKASQALRQALAQPEQEPVAWMNKKSTFMCGKTDESGVAFHIITTSKQTKHHNVPLYTAPPKREWKGLTMDDKHFLLANAWNKEQAFDGFMDAIDKFLEEKNT